MRRTLTTTLVALLTSVTLAGCAAEPTDALDWSGYPAAAGIAVDDALANPGEGDIAAHGEEVLQSMMTELQEEFGVSGWAAHTDESFSPYGDNGFGGESMLLTYSAPIWQSETPVPSGDWDDLLAVATEVAARHEMTPIDDGSTSEWMSQLTLTDGTSYLDVLVVDLTEADYQREEAEAGGEPTQGVSLTFGAVVIPDDERDAFAKAAQPFIGEPLPAP